MCVCVCGEKELWDGGRAMGHDCEEKQTKQKLIRAHFPPLHLLPTGSVGARSIQPPVSISDQRQRIA